MRVELIALCCVRECVGCSVNGWRLISKVMKFPLDRSSKNSDAFILARIVTIRDDFVNVQELSWHKVRCNLRRIVSIDGDFLT